MGLWGRIRRCSQCRGSETVLCDYGSMSMHGWRLLMEPVLPLVSSLDPLCLMPVDRASELYQRAILFYLSPPGFRCFQSKCMQMRTKWKKLMTNLNSHCLNYVPHEPHTLHTFVQLHIRAESKLISFGISVCWQNLRRKWWIWCQVSPFVWNGRLTAIMIMNSGKWFCAWSVPLGHRVELERVNCFSFLWFCSLFSSFDGPSRNRI